MNKPTAYESIAIKKYLRYVKQRVKYLRNRILDCSDNQISYFNAMDKVIDDFANNHKLFMKYALGKITFEEVKSILGEDDRQILRYLRRQRKLFMNYIQENESEYFNKYPFDDISTLNIEVDYER